MKHYRNPELENKWSCRIHNTVDKFQKVSFLLFWSHSYIWNRSIYIYMSVCDVYITWDIHYIEMVVADSVYKNLFYYSFASIMYEMSWSSKRLAFNSPQRNALYVFLLESIIWYYFFLKALKIQYKTSLLLGTKRYALSNINWSFDIIEWKGFSTGLQPFKDQRNATIIQWSIKS